MHQARSRVSSLPAVYRRLFAALCVAWVLATASAVVIKASDGPYNTNPLYCHSHSPLEPLWWWYECYYPDPPDQSEGG